jgi:hypothetical protein
MKKIIFLTLICSLLPFIYACGTNPQNSSACKRADSDLAALYNLKSQAEESLKIAKDKNQVLFLPNHVDSEEVTQARAQLENVQNSINEKIKERQEACGR